MIEKGILAIMIIATVNAVLIISGFVTDIDSHRAVIPGLPQGLSPTGFTVTDTGLDFTETGVDPTETDLVTAALHTLAGFLFNIPLAGNFLKAILSIGAIFFDFMFFWATALNVSGLPPFLIYVIAVPLAMFEYGILIFLGFSVLQIFFTSRKG